MAEKLWKGFLYAVSFIGVFTLVFFIKSEVSSYTNEISARQYLYMQQKYIADFEAYADDVDDVVSLYLIGSIDEDTFLAHIEVFETELDSLYQSYLNDQEEYPVRDGSHTYYTKLGCEAVEDCFDIFYAILDMMEDYSSDPDEMSYRYIAYHQDIINALADYIAAYELEFETTESGDAEDE